MGCDIHLITEIKKDNKWEMIEENPEGFNCRNYYNFAILANVRNSFSINGFEPKGLPKDISCMRVGFNSEFQYIKNNYNKHIETCYFKDGIKYNILDAPKECEKRDIPVKELYTLEEYCNLYYKSSYDKWANDYGYWDVNFDYDYFSHSYLSLKELKDYITKIEKSCYVSEEFYNKFIELGGELPNGMTFDRYDDNIIVNIEDDDEVNMKNSFIDSVEELEQLAIKYKVKDNDIRIVFAFDN